MKSTCTKAYANLLLLFWSLTLLGLDPIAVPTFHSISVYWKTENGSPNNDCFVFFQKQGEQAWRKGHNLWYDQHTHPNEQFSYITFNEREYRGSLVQLEPSTTYNIKLQLKSGEVRQLQATTWDEQFKIQKTVRLSSTPTTITISEGGNRTNGYILYDGVDAHVTGGVNNVEIRADYVIIRGLTGVNASSNGIWIEPGRHDIVIEHCDISKWGSRRNNSPFGTNMQSAIFQDNNNHPNFLAGRFIIQHNKLHHPNTDANSWSEGGHPEGPQAITLEHGLLGNNVIRYNKIYSDEQHCFNDAMGSQHGNFSFDGFLFKDSDIYGNEISGSWDDGIEIEGAGMNIRIWDNYFSYVNFPIAAASISLGPLYIFRNISGYSRSSPKGERGWGFLKLGAPPDKSHYYANGKIYIYHNTIHQPMNHGVKSALNVTSQKYRQKNVTSINNIYNSSNGRTISHIYQLPGLVTNYDMIPIYGIAPPSETRITAFPLYSSGYTEKSYKIALKENSPGHDQGLIINNFNDNYSGAAPDLGAIESKSKECAVNKLTNINLPTKILKGEDYVLTIPYDSLDAKIIDIQLRTKTNEVVGRATHPIEPPSSGELYISPIFNFSRMPSGTQYKWVIKLIRIDDTEYTHLEQKNISVQ